MLWDAWSIALGASLGLSAGGLLWWLSMRSLATEPTDSRLKMTAGWRLGELTDPIIVARVLEDVDVPAGARVYASERVDAAVLGGCDVHMVPHVRAEFAAAGDFSKALIFTSGIAEGCLALLCEDPVLLGRLRTEWQHLSARGSDYVERLRVGELAGKAGLVVETQGVVQDVLPYQDGFMMRVEDDGAIIAVLVDKDPEGLADERILVRGVVEKQGGGYLALRASDVRRMR